MDKPAESLRILMLEDTPSDAELEQIALQDAGIVFTALRVDTREAYAQALDAFKPDIILADYKLPAYNGQDALEHARLTHPDIPVIMVTGALGDEPAIELLKLGAKDYVLKGNLVRLAPAIHRALSEERGIRNRKLAERALQESEQRYRRLFEAAKDGILILDAETGKIVDANPFILNLLSYSRSECIGKMLWDIGLFANTQASKSAFEELQHTGHIRYENLPLKTKDGQRRNVEFISNVYPVNGGKVIQCNIRDITERLQVEGNLAANEALLRQFIQYTPAAIAMLDTQMRYIQTSARWIQDYHLTDQDIVGKSHYEVFPEIPQRWKDIHQRVLAGAIERCEEDVFPRADGSTDWLQWEARPWRKPGGEIGGLILFSQVITERKRADEAIRKANRALKALGACNMSLLHAEDEGWLLNEICRIVVEVAGYRLAWVGLAEHDAQKTVRPVAYAGCDASFMEHAQITWDDSASGQGPAGAAIRTQQTQIVQDAHTDPKYAPWRDNAIKIGYRSILCLPFAANGAELGALCIYAADRDGFDTEEIALLTELANDLSFGIITLRTRAEHRQSTERLRRGMESTIEALAGTLELRDAYTAGHQIRVAELAAAIAKEMGHSEDEAHGIRLAGTVHDLGKIQVPSEILSKPTRLSALEYDLVKTHAQAGYDLLKDIDFPWPIAQMVYQHHERLDGSGYPRGLRGEAMLIGAKILAVADVMEAMSSHRPYRPGLGIDAALAEIKKNRGVLYDAAVADACEKLFREQRFAFSDVVRAGKTTGGLAPP